MKRLLFSLSIIATGLSLTSQTATNFNTNDCNSINHDLFSELDAGKVVVITWVMPCSACINGATYAQNAVLSFSATNPGQVVHYVADDYANTNCSSLGSWCTTNNINPDAKFSSSLVNMSGYGAAGMPKVVVLGGTSHTVFYNQNGSANSQSGIQAAITNALGAVGMKEMSSGNLKATISPNPVNTEMTINFNSSDKVTIEIYSVIGQKVKSFECNAPEFKFNAEFLANGTYFAKVSDGKSTETVKFIIAH